MFSRHSLYGIIAVLGLICLPSLSHASINAMTKVYFQQSQTLSGGRLGGAGGGGVFDLYDYDSDVLLGQTVCVEVDERIAMGKSNWMWMASATDRAILGGKNTNAADPLSRVSDLIFDAWNSSGSQSIATWDLSTVGYTGGSFQFDNQDWANALQRAIWVEEEEKSGYSGNDSYKYKAKAIHDYAKNLATSSPTFSGNVSVLNLFKGSNDTDYVDYLTNTYDPLVKSTWDYSSRLKYKHKQDQLFYMEDPSGDNNPVPEPATIAIWSAIGLGGLIAQRRFRRKQKAA